MKRRMMGPSEQLAASSNATSSCMHMPHANMGLSSALEASSPGCANELCSRRSTQQVHVYAAPSPPPCTPPRHPHIHQWRGRGRGMLPPSPLGWSLPAPPGAASPARRGGRAPAPPPCCAWPWRTGKRHRRPSSLQQRSPAQTRRFHHVWKRSSLLCWFRSKPPACAWPASQQQY